MVHQGWGLMPVHLVVPSTKAPVFEKENTISQALEYVLYKQLILTD